MGPQLRNRSTGIIRYLEFRYLGYSLPIRPNRYFSNHFLLYCICAHQERERGTVQAPCASYKLELHIRASIVQICARAPH